MASLLLVDDDEDVLNALAAVLATTGHKVARAAGGVAALDILDGREPLDLLLTDVVMPGLHGFNLARMAVLRRPELRVLYMSGFTELDVVTQDTGPRYGKLLEKPMRPDQLRLEVEQALAQRPPGV